STYGWIEFSVSVPTRSGGLSQPERADTNYLSMTASTSRAESTRYSSPAYFTSVPPYLLYSTTSPTLTSIGTRLVPASSKRPGPTARTSPSWGFSLAVSGITRPDAVVCSASSGLTTIRSSSGLITTLVAVDNLTSPSGKANGELLERDAAACRRGCQTASSR